MAIYRGSGGAGDATGDATNASQLAVAAADEAQASATSAASSATSAAASASAAAADAADAAASETNAAGSAADALASENAAASSASDAADSATAAATSATNAASSASTASTQATNASNSASSASTSATNAANSATSASTSASTASTKASEAATSATNAGNSATAAATSATDAAASASTASTQATNASNSATNAASSATAASSSASSASSSASAASTSATNAASSASSASSSASSASTSATNASNSASAAATSATNAANSATAAASSASNASASATLAASFTPSQTGNSGKFLTTDGSQTSWGTPTSSISDGSVTPAKLSTGGPSWDSSGNVSTTGNTRLNNGAADGAQLQLASSGYSDWNLDNYSGRLRAYYGSTEYFAIDPNGIVTGTAGSLMLVRGTAVASTSGTAIDFTGIPSWAKRITVMLRGVSSNGTAAFLLQLGTSGGFVSSGYVSQNSYLYSNIVTTSSTAGLLLTGTNATAESVTGQFVVSNQDSNTWVGNGGMARSGGVYLQMNAGGVDLGGTLDRIRVTTVGGTQTFDAGSINIFYE